MKIIRYVHDRKLGARPLSRPYTLASLDMDNTENLTVISFSDCLDRPADETYIVNGCSRFFIADLQNVALVNVQNDSAFYAHMLWDITHQMPAGGKLYIREKIRCETLLERGYYREAFTESPESVSGFRVYQKNSLWQPRGIKGSLNGASAFRLARKSRHLLMPVSNAYCSWILRKRRSFCAVHRTRIFVFLSR
ncbi:Uncharacterised protein [Tatumella ptyseos]|uniref:Uncharacterized protein n=1 Tax=Tatumella ptyseos TaxID=82987 RepID=A0A2X5PG73_9GAMM|nr:Uncharacterised protein [Tatumella ptyseos]